MRLTAFSCSDFGFLENHAHWCTSKDIFGREF
jgi:hypothetical protein